MVVLADLAHDLEVPVPAVHVFQLLVQRRDALVEPVDVAHDARQNVQLDLLVGILHRASEPLVLLVELTADPLQDKSLSESH